MSERFCPERFTTSLPHNLSVDVLNDNIINNIVNNDEDNEVLFLVN